MAEINLVTCAGATVKPINDAIIQDSIEQTGIYKGCEITWTGTNVLHITAGYGMIKGRHFEVTEQDITATLSESGTIQGRMYIHMDLTSDTTIDILTETAAMLSDLTQDENVNYNNSVYDLELCTFNIDETMISSLVTTFEYISSPIGAEYDKNTNYVAGAYCLRNNRFYVCTTATSGSWTPSAWEEKTLAEVIGQLNSRLNELIVSCTQAEYDAMASHNPTTLYVITGD